MSISMSWNLYGCLAVQRFTVVETLNMRVPLFIFSILLLPKLLQAFLRRSSSGNAANGLMVKLSSSDAVMDHTFYSQSTRSIIECIALCTQTDTRLSVYFEIISTTCNLNNNFIPQFLLNSSYTPSTGDIRGWDPRGLVSTNRFRLWITIILFIYLFCGD